MASSYDTNIDTNYPLIYQQYSPPVVSTTTFSSVGDSTTVVTTINGNSGQATGPVITLSGGSTGYEFDASMGSIVLSVGNAATVRSSISAAKSGANSDITSFTALTGNTGVSPWTGTANGGPFATYSGTASAGYVQAELQGAMDALRDATQFLMFLTAALLAWGGVET